VTQAKPDRSARRGSETRARTNQVKVALSDAELAKLDALRGKQSAGAFLRTALEPVTEYAIQMSSGAMQVRNGEPYVERVYPLADWIAHGQENGGKVYRRRVIVVDDWEEVPGA